jgi:rod shape-determining protein MreB
MAKIKEQHIKVGVDLGTANLLVYVDGEGIVFNEPSVIAMEYETDEVIAVGKAASQMIGRGHHGIKIISPLNQGVISDMNAAKKLLEVAVRKAENTNVNFTTSTLLVCAPSEVTGIERDALTELAHNLGVPDVFIEEEVKAGAIGAGLDIYDSTGSIVIDIGGGTTDIGVLSLGDIVVSESIRVAGNHLDQVIINYLQYEKGLLIGKKTAQRIKEEIGTLKKELPQELETTASGRDIVTGLPRKITIKQSEVRDIFIEPFQQIANTILRVLQNTPPELSADIIKRGMIVNGGCALIDGVAEFLEEEIGLKTLVAKNPLTAIVEGTKVLLQNRGNYYIRPLE